MKNGTRTIYAVLLDGGKVINVSTKGYAYIIQMKTAGTVTVSVKLTPNE